MVNKVPTPKEIGDITITALASICDFSPDQISDSQTLKDLGVPDKAFALDLLYGIFRVLRSEGTDIHILPTGRMSFLDKLSIPGKGDILSRITVARLVSGIHDACQKVSTS